LRSKRVDFDFPQLSSAPSASAALNPFLHYCPLSRGEKQQLNNNPNLVILSDGGRCCRRAKDLGGLIRAGARKGRFLFAGRHPERGCAAAESKDI